MRALRALAPAKVNLGLFVGPRRASDSRHELATVMQAISLADEVSLAPASGEQDEVISPGVPVAVGENLAVRALRGFREATGWPQSPVRLEICKQIPVAAGLAGGSADAGATLRLLAQASGLGDESLLLELARALGADVPAQLRPGRVLAAGAGERLTRLADPQPQLGVLVLPLAAALATAEVYAEADRLGVVRSAQEIGERGRELAVALELGGPLPQRRELLHNDLERAALSLCPAISGALEQARDAGAEHALVSGSGPSVVALFARANSAARAERAAAALMGREPAAIAAHSVGVTFGAPRPAAAADSGGRRGRASQSGANNE